MKQATFEVAALADAVNKAARIAPVKGAAYDKSAGLLLEVDPQRLDGIVVLKSTDLEISYMENITALEMGDERAVWRLPSGLFQNLLATLPIGSGQNVTLTSEESRITFRAGRKKGKLALIPPASFPQWDYYDPAELEPAGALAARIKQVSWACDKATPPFSGVHVNGNKLIATDKYRLVSVPCVVPVDTPITVPLTPLVPLISASADIKMAVHERELRIMPDEYTQIRSTIFDMPYPDEERMRSVMRNDFTHEVELDRQEIVNALTNMNVLVKTERYPNCNFAWTEGKLNLFMSVLDSGELEDRLDVNYDGEPFTFDITPSFLLDALAVVDKPKIMLRFGADPFRTIGIDDGDGYTAWIMPRKV